MVFSLARTVALTYETRRSRQDLLDEGIGETWVSGICQQRSHDAHTKASIDTIVQWTAHRPSAQIESTPGFADRLPDGWLHLPSNNHQRMKIVSEEGILVTGGVGSTAHAAIDSDPLIAHETQPTKTVAELVRSDERLKEEFARIRLPLLISSWDRRRRHHNLDRGAASRRCQIRLR